MRILLILCVLLLAGAGAASAQTAPDIKPVIAIDLRVGQSVPVAVFQQGGWVAQPGWLSPWPRCVAISGNSVVAIAAGECSILSLAIDGGHQPAFADAPIFFRVREAAIATTINIVVPATLQVGQTSQASPEVLDQYGERMAAPELRWKSTKTSVATIGSVSGIIIARAPGVTNIYAKVGTLESARLRLTVF